MVYLRLQYESVSQQLEQRWKKLLSRASDSEQQALLRQQMEISETFQKMCDIETLIGKAAVEENANKEEMKDLQVRGLLLCACMVITIHPSSLNVQEAEQEIRDAVALIEKGTVVISFLGDKRAGKSFCINHIIRRLLALRIDPDESGKIPLPSVSGIKDGSPWPLIIQ